MTANPSQFSNPRTTPPLTGGVFFSKPDPRKICRAVFPQASTSSPQAFRGNAQLFHRLFHKRPYIITGDKITFYYDLIFIFNFIFIFYLILLFTFPLTLYLILLFFLLSQTVANLCPFCPARPPALDNTIIPHLPGKIFPTFSHLHLAQNREKARNVYTFCLWKTHL